MPVLNGKYYPYKRYQPGEKITSLDELARQERIFCNGQLLDRGWFISWQFRVADGFVKGGHIRYAIKKEEKDGKTGD